MPGTLNEKKMKTDEHKKKIFFFFRNAVDLVKRNLILFHANNKVAEIPSLNSGMLFIFATSFLT